MQIFQQGIVTLLRLLSTENYAVDGLLRAYIARSQLQVPHSSGIIQRGTL